MTRSNYAHRYMDGLRKGENGLYWLYRRLLYDMRYNEKDESRILLCLPQKKLILCCNKHFIVCYTPQLLFVDCIQNISTPSPLRTVLG